MSTRALVLAAIRRAGAEGIEAVELRLAYGTSGVTAAHALVRDGLAERVSIGLYRARRGAS